MGTGCKLQAVPPSGPPTRRHADVTSLTHPNAIQVMARISLRHVMAQAHLGSPADAIYKLSKQLWAERTLWPGDPSTPSGALCTELHPSYHLHFP